VAVSYLAENRLELPLTDDPRVVVFVTTVHSPTAGRRRLRNALRQARDAAGLTQENVAEEMDWSLSKVIRIETGVVSISTNDLRELLRLYRIDDPEQVRELVELARIGRRKPWWTRYKDVVPQQYLSYIGLEDECNALRLYYPFSLPGLFQTEEFARAVLNAVVPPHLSRGTEVAPLTQADMEARVQLRMVRQEKVLGREVPPEITAILDEAVLHRQVGGPEVLRRQLLHLVALASNPHIRIHVLPFTARVVTMLSAFTILSFPDPSDTDVVSTEYAFEYQVLDNPTDVENYQLCFRWLREAALPEDESLSLIARIAGELG